MELCTCLFVLSSSIGCSRSIGSSLFWWKSHPLQCLWNVQANLSNKMIDWSLTLTISGYKVIHLSQSMLQVFPNLAVFSSIDYKVKCVWKSIAYSEPLLQGYRRGHERPPSWHRTAGEPLEGGRDPPEARDCKDCELHPRLAARLGESRAADDTVDEAGFKAVSSDDSKVAGYIWR